MALLDRVNEDRDKKLLAEAEQSLQQARAQQQVLERRLEIVGFTLEAKATLVDETLEVLYSTVVGFPTYFLFGGVVVMVQQFSNLSSDAETEIVNEGQVTTMYYVAVVGADKRSETSTESIRVGTLKWLDYEGFYKAISNAPSYLDFDPRIVLERLGL